MLQQYRIAAACLACAFYLVSQAAAQGLLVDVRPDSHHRLPRPIVPPTPTPPPGCYRIEAIDVNVKLSDQVARVQLSQTFENVGSQQMEVAFVFPLPYDGAIDRLTLLVDGREHEAKLLPAEEARKVYEEIVRKNRDPALLEWLGNGMFRTSVFPVPTGAKRTVTLRYSQLCRNSHGLTDFLFPLSTAKYTSRPVEKLSIQVAIDSKVPIKNVYSATHAVDIERPDTQHAIVKYQAKDVLPAEDFRLFYDARDGDLAASVVSYRPDHEEDGYFLLLASPEIETADAKRADATFVFVVDRSGSMSGEKIQQAKGALNFVLNNLREDDLFNIVAYDSEIEVFRPELQRFNDETRQQALGFVEGIYAGGSTDIDAALRRAMGMLTDSDRTAYVVFLTDGLPTSGETKEAVIAKNASKANNVRARLFAFGVGYDVNGRLLDKLARDNFGQSEYVRPDEDIEAAVSKLYRRIESPVMTDVKIEMVGTGDNPADARLSRVYPKGTFDLFAGEQLVVVGRYANPSWGSSRRGVVRITGTLDVKEQSFEFPIELVTKSDDDTNAFVARLWATRRVGEIIDELDLKGRNEELVKELVTLATEYGILTPYTSFLADETSNVCDLARNSVRSFEFTEELERNVSGALGVNQRMAKGRFQAAERAAVPLSAASNESRGAMTLEAVEREKLVANAGRGSVYYDFYQDKQVASTNVWNVGRKTFFQRNGRWVDSSVSEDDEKNAQQIERFSREYFDLVARYGKHVTQYLAIDEPVVVKLGGQTYEW